MENGHSGGHNMLRKKCLVAHCLDHKYTDKWSAY